MSAVKHLSVWESDAVRTPDWHINLCMNDENGNDTGRVSAIEVSTIMDDEASFSHTCNGVKGGIGDGFVRISRRKFPITGMNEYVGNIFWNLVTVKPEVGAQIMQYLTTLDGLQCEGGTIDFLRNFGIE